MATSKPIIVKCSIGPYPRPMPMGIKDPLPSVNVVLDNGEEHKLFEFYPDEISFTESEFIGLTLDFARRLKYEKDIWYIQSFMKTR
jgi:hypothetical protein